MRTHSRPHRIGAEARLLAWRVAGFISLALGLLGILVPLLPTTPFLLLATFCFGRGSQRLQQWLVEHPRLGPPIRDWQDHRAISRRAKTFAAVGMVLVVLGAVLLGAPRVVIATQVVVLAAVGSFVFTRPAQ